MVKPTPSGMHRSLIPRRPSGFSLVEVLVVLGIVAVLAALVIPTALRSQRAAERADSSARLRAMSQAILLYATDHQQTLPGPLWPGQVMLYDPLREGRLVRDIADYLQVERKDTPYLAAQLIPHAYRRAMRGTKMDDARIYVVNSAIDLEGGGKLEPFGVLTGPAVLAPLKLPQVQGLPAEDDWMIAETDQQHPAVASAAWKANTPALPVHGNARALARFDGSVAWGQYP
jgi:prepilin-type N-terminal cleavage/methylation domain-containing protein